MKNANFVVDRHSMPFKQLFTHHHKTLFPMDQNTSVFKTGDQPRSKRGLIVLLIPGLLLGLTLAIFYYFSYDGIRKDVKQRAESELREKCRRYVPDSGEVGERQ